MTSIRDLKQAQQAVLDKKRDVSQVTRAVILEINGSIWANESERRVWYLPNGATQPGQVLCIRGGVRPQHNLPVLVGKADGSDVLEVLSVDPLVMVNQASLPSQVADHSEEHEAGPLYPGRDVMNVYSRQIVPLQTYYAGANLLINVMSGWYDYKGILKRFKGRQNYDLSTNQPTSGNVRKVGIYIDSTNILQTVNGSTVADTVTNIPEPIWPVGSFPLCVVRLNGTQATIAYADIQDRRGLFGTSDINLFPPDGKIIIDTTTYDTLTAANTAAGTGDFVHIGPGTFSFDNLTLKAATYKGQGPYATTLTSTFSTGDVLTLPSGCVLEDMWLDFDIASATQRAGIKISTSANVVIRNCVLDFTNTTGSLWGILNDVGGTLMLYDCTILSTASGIARGARVYQSTLITYNCIIQATGTAGYLAGGTPYSRDIEVGDSTAVVNLYDTELVNDTLVRDTDFGPTNIIHSWAATPPAQFNPIINGGLAIWQHGTSFSPGAFATIYTADMFEYVININGANTVSQSADVPTVAQAGQKIPYSLLADCTAADTTISAGQHCYFAHKIEGHNWQKFAQGAFWLGYWVKATKTGVYCTAFRNAGNDRSYVAEYTVNASDVWEFKETYVPASPSAGTWDYANGLGLSIVWPLAMNSTFYTTPNAWQTGDYLATSAQVNACDNVANNWQIAGIMMSQNRSPFWQSDYQQELARCQRYYWQFNVEGYSPGYAGAISTTAARGFVPTPVQMRTLPNVSGFTFLRGNGGAIGITGLTPTGAEWSSGVAMDITVASGLTAFETYLLGSSAGSNIVFSAEL